MAGNPTGHVENRDPAALAASQSLPSDVPTGALVRVRGRRWRIDARVVHEDCRELHLRAADGESHVLLWPFDRPSPVDERRGPRLLRLAPWTARAGAALAGALEARAPRGVFRGEVLPYQLAPAVAIASGVSRVLLADGVGLGKTIQAGWIAA